MQSVARNGRLKTHCIHIGGTHNDHEDPACLTMQTEPVDAITFVHSSLVTAISAALAAVRGELTFFLRDGDCWSDDFVSRIASVYQKHPEADVVYCNSIAEPEKNGRNSPEVEAIDLGFTAVATYAGLNHVAPPLSCFAIRRRVVERILPLVSDPDWATEPDACLSIAASLASARTFHLPLPLVHLENIAPQPDPSDFAHRLKLMRLVGKIANRLSLNPDFVKQFLVMEYTSQPKDPATITRYCRLLQAYLPDTRSRREILLSMYRKMKDHLHNDGSLAGYASRWWLKQKLLWTGKLTV
jgi:hypothetical protein